MFKNVFIITLLMFVGVLYAENKSAYEPKFDDVDMSLQGIGSELGVDPVLVPVPAPEPQVIAPTPAPAPAPAPAPIQVVTPAPQKVEKVKTKVDGPIYHYSYVPDDTVSDIPSYEQDTRAGHRGDLVFLLVGEAVIYKGYNAGKPGFETELGWQFNLFKYLSLLASIDVGYRKGNLTSKNLIPLGAKGALRFRLLPWLFPYFESGFECIKVSGSGWEQASTDIGGGLLIRIGYADRKAEYSLYRAIGITRTMLVFGFDHVKAHHNSIVVPDASLIKGGLSFEF